MIDPGYSAVQVLKLWTDGATVASGTATHDAKGITSIVVPALKAGAYRLRYEIYPGKACVNETATACKGCLEGRIRSAFVVVDNDGNEQRLDRFDEQ